MRPQKAHNLLRKSIENYLYKSVSFKSNSLSAAKKLLEKAFISEQASHDYFNLGTITHDLEAYKEPYDIEEGCYTHLMYISDRFNCVHRLVWFVHGLENNFFDVKNIKK